MGGKNIFLSGTVDLKPKNFANFAHFQVEYLLICGCIFIGALPQIKDTHIA